MSRPKIVRVGIHFYMGPVIEQKRVAGQERDNSFRHLAAPALSLGLDMVAFGHGPAAVKALFLENPLLFANIPAADGTRLPSIKSMIADAAIAERSALLAA